VGKFDKSEQWLCPPTLNPRRLAHSGMSESIHSQGTEVTERLSNSLSQERLHHPISPGYPTIAPSLPPLSHQVFPEYPAITPPSFPLIPAYPIVAPSSFPLSHPVSPGYCAIIPPSFSLNGPAAYPDMSPSSYNFNHPVSSEYRAIAPPSFALHHPVSPAHPIITSPSVPCFSGSLTQIDSHSGCPLVGEDRPRLRARKIVRIPHRRMSFV